MKRTGMEAAADAARWSVIDLMRQGKPGVVADRVRLAKQGVSWFDEWERLRGLSASREAAPWRAAMTAVLPGQISEEIGARIYYLATEGVMHPVFLSADRLAEQFRRDLGRPELEIVEPILRGFLAAADSVTGGFR